MGKPVKVETYSGYKADERPTAFISGTEKIAVREIVDRWYDRDANYFKVASEDGAVFLLRHDLNNDRWELVERNEGGDGHRGGCGV